MSFRHETFCAEYLCGLEFRNAPPPSIDKVRYLFLFLWMQDTLSTLRQALAKPGLAETPLVIPLGHAPIDQTLGGGLRAGACHEVYAAAGHEVAATGFAAGLALRLAGAKQLLWIGQEFSHGEYGYPCPTGLIELGLDPARLLALSVAKPQDALRAAGDALTCASLGAVIIEIVGSPKVFDLTASRRLVLAAAQHAVSVILLRFGTEPEASAAETRWLVKAASSAQPDWGQPIFDVSLIRNKNGPMGQWVLAWSCDHGRFENQTAAVGAVFCAPADRPAEAA